MGEVYTEEELITDERLPRWYDAFPETEKVLRTIQNMDPIKRSGIMDELIAITSQIKDFHKEEEEPEISIGIERVLGLYQQSNGRRWYDKDRKTNYAMQVMSTLPKADFKNIMEGLAATFVNDENKNM